MRAGRPARVVARVRGSSRWASRRSSRRRDERGAVVLFVAVTMSVLLVIAAFAVDLGQQRVVRRDMQALADVVALDLGRLMGQRTEAQLNTLKTSAIAATVSRNDDTLGGPPTVTADFGQVDPVTGVFGRVAGGAFPTAVRVTARASVDFSFRPGSGSATRSAVSVADKSACLKVGSTALDVRAGQSGAINLLNGILKDATGVDLLTGGVGVLGYQGLATANVTLAQLVAVPSLNAASPQALLSAPGLSVGQFNAAVLTALSNQTPRNTAAINALQIVNANLGPVASQPVRLGDLLGLDQSNDSALAAGINVLDFVTAGALIADNDHAVNLTNLGVNLGLSSVRGSLAVIQAPMFRCGRVGSVTATSSQADAAFTGTLLTVPALTIPLITSLSTTVGSASVNLSLAKSTAVLRDITCKTAVAGSTDKLTADVTSGLLSAGVTVPFQIKGKIGVTSAFGLPALADITIDLTARVTTGPSGAANLPGQVLTLPPNNVTPLATGSGTVGLAGSAVVTNNPPPGISVKLLGISLPLLPGVQALLLTQVQSAVTAALTPLLSTLDAALLGPLTRLLGLRVAGSDLFGDAAVCNNSTLRQ